MQNVEKINALEDAYEKLTNEQLRAKSDDFRKKLRFVCSFFLIFLLMCLFVCYFIFGLLFIYIENNNNSNVNYNNDDDSDIDDNFNNIT
jgi:curved DNA-binding protein CbpA